MEYGLLPGRYPAIVREYMQASRTCRIEIPGLTDGGDVLPEAEIEYPIGDKSRSGQFETEIEMLPGDTVWIAFEGGDPRYPIITGYRNPKTGNSVDWRRWHHKNVEILIDQVCRQIAGGDFLIKSGSHITVQAPLVTILADQTEVTGAMTVHGLMTYLAGLSGTGASNVEGNFSVNGTMKNNDVNIGSDHTHTEQGDGAEVSTPH